MSFPGYVGGGAAHAVIMTWRLRNIIGSVQKGHIHAHFLHRTALVGKLLAHTLNCPYSISAHGRDVFSPDFQLNGLSNQAKFISVCSAHAEHELARQLDERNRRKVVRCYHGLNLDRFCNGKSPDARLHDPPSLISVCRLVRKKGIDTVIHALSILEDRGISLNYRIVGTGREEKGLRDLSQRLGLHGSNSWADYRQNGSERSIRSQICLR